jgi:hypothetical protein
MEPEDCLRSLAASALRRAHPARPLFPVSLSLMAVANAFVMLGLLPEPHAESVLAEHRLALEQKGFGDTWGVTKGELTVRPGAHEYWQARSAGHGGLREVPLAVSAQVVVGTSDPPWPTPAECYLAQLAPVTHYSIATSSDKAELGPEETAEIVATVADSLMAVGALPTTSTLLRDPPAGTPSWHAALARRWGRRAREQPAGIGAAEHRGLAIRLPLDHATAVIESVLVQGELVSIQLYGHPWVMGEYWPMITPCFQVRATDDTGSEYEGRPGGWQGSGGHEGTGSFWFWPPVETGRRYVRVTVSTLWEAAWAEIELPR